MIGLTMTILNFRLLVFSYFIFDVIENSNFELIDAGKYFPNEYVDRNGCVQTYPNVQGIDGAFAAKLRLKIN